MSTISIKKIIDVTTSIAPTPQGRRNFARATVVQKVAGAANDSRGYSSASDVLEGQGSNSEAYKFAQKYFAGGFNGIKPNFLYVTSLNSTGLTSSTHGSFTSGSASAHLAAFQGVDDGEIKIAIDGSSAITVGNIDLTSALSLEDVAALIQEKARLTSALLRKITVAYNAPNFIFTSPSYGSSSTLLVTAGVSGTNLLGASYLNGGSSAAGTTGTLADLIAIVLSDPSYYHVCLSNDWNDEEILEWSAAIESATKITYLLWALSTDSNIADETLAADTDSIARTLFDQKDSKTSLIYDATNIGYKQASLPSYFGIVNFSAAQPLGTLAFKQFPNQLPTDLDSANFDNLVSKNVNFYSTYGEIGRNIAYPGKVPSGSFINDIIAVDYIDYNMTYNVFDLLITLPKIGYTVEDFAKLYSAIERVFLSALASGIIAGGTDPDTGEVLLNGYSISIPAPADIPPADKAAGIIQGIVCVGLLKGTAIKFVINNTLKFS